MKFGFEGRYLQINARRYINANGSFSFNGSETGFGFADFLLGYPSSAQVGLGRRIRAPSTRSLRRRFVSHPPEPHHQLWIALGIQHALVRYTGPHRDVGSWAAVEGLPDGSQRLARTRRRWNPADPRAHRLQQLQSAGRHAVTNSPACFGTRVAKDQHPRIPVFTTAIEDATLFIIWGDAPYGMFCWHCAAAD